MVRKPPGSVADHHCRECSVDTNCTWLSKFPNLATLSQESRFVEGIFTAHNATWHIGLKRNEMQARSTMGSGGSPPLSAARVATASKISVLLPVVLVSFALVAFLAFQTLRDRRESVVLLDAKDAELQDVYRKLQDAKKMCDDLRQSVSKLSADKERVSTDKYNVSTKLIELESYKESADEERKQLEASVQEKENQILILTQQLQQLQDDDRELRHIEEELKMSSNSTNEVTTAIATATTTAKELDSSHAQDIDDRQREQVINNELVSNADDDAAAAQTKM